MWVPHKEKRGVVKEIIAEEVEVIKEKKVVVDRKMVGKEKKVVEMKVVVDRKMVGKEKKVVVDKKVVGKEKPFLLGCLQHGTLRFTDGWVLGGSSMDDQRQLMSLDKALLPFF
ncbi:hypothetical protein DPEC_G00305910 [Dallia pectoralis]|uniref:Uncharacterized protein n=1 Tax=Dallia pectoralis TaxID=75939 RepID=A0ACC2FEB4_DALPE|nr:hypothetical protein DPEC_G00305910 [Dallia pectoralis]